MFYNHEYEQIILGAILLDTKILDEYDFREDLFHDIRNKKIYLEIIKAIESGITPDIIILSERLKDISAVYISEFPGKSFSIANVEFYRSELEELEKKRKLDMLFKVCAVELNSKSSKEIIEHIEELLTNLNSAGKKEYKLIRDYLPKAIERLENKYHGKHDGLKFGWRATEYIVDEIPNGSFNIIAARPSLGKTAIMLNIAYNLTKQKRKIGIFSSEMAGDLLSERIIQFIALVNTRKMYNATNKDFERITDACEKIYDLNIVVDDTPNIYLYELKSKSRKMKREGIDVIFIDYLSLIQISNDKLNLYEKYGKISSDLKSLARELDIPIIALHQLNRDAEDNRPILKNLRDSGRIEQDGDIIILLSGDRKEQDMELFFDVAKNRFGAAAETRLLFKKNYQLITDIALDKSDSI